MQHMIALRFLNVFLLSHRESSTRKSVVWNFRKFMEKHMRWSLFFIKISTLLKRDSKTVFFPWILKNFFEHLFYRTPPSDLFMDKNLCCLLTRIWLNSIFHWRVHAFVCILILYSRYFRAASLLKIVNTEVSSGNILHIDSILSGK